MAVGLAVVVLALAMPRLDKGSGDVQAHQTIKSSVLFSVTFALASVAFVYLFLVAAGRANLRPATDKPLEIFQFGYYRFHFFWVTIVWPWVVLGAFNILRSRIPVKSLTRGAIVAGVLFVAYAAWAGAFRHMSMFQALGERRVEGVECLQRKLAGPDETLLCESVELSPLNDAVRYSEKIDASFSNGLRDAATDYSNFDADKSEPLVMDNKSYVDGSVVVRRTGSLVGASVRIGTFDSSADGKMYMTLCGTSGCATGAAELARSIDNSFVEILLPTQLRVTQGETLKYRVGSVDSSRPYAIWLYPAMPDSATIGRHHSGDGDDVPVDGRTLRIGLRYGK